MVENTFVSKSVRNIKKFIEIRFNKLFLFMKNSKKSVVQRVKVFKLLNGEYNKISKDLNVKIVDNYSQQIINLFRIQIKKYGSRIG